MSDKDIFLSHAHDDREIADLLSNMLILAGVPEPRIFYSSNRYTGIPAGEDIRTYLQRTLQGAGLVVELISQTFLRRPMCLMELGGAWALGTPTYPVVVPPLSREQVRAQIGDVQMGVLETGREIEEFFDELHDRLVKDVNIQTPTPRWNRAVREFKSQLPAKLVMVPGDIIEPRAEQTLVALASDSGLPAAEIGGDSKEPVVFSDISVTKIGQKLVLRGQAVNNDNVRHTLYIKAVFYNDQGQIIGSKSGRISALTPGGMDAFAIHGIPEHNHYKIQIDRIFDF